MNTNNILTIVMQVAVLVIGLLGGAATVPIIRWLKNTLNTNGGQTLALVAVVAGLLAARTSMFILTVDEAN